MEQLDWSGLRNEWDREKWRYVRSLIFSFSMKEAKKAGTN